MRFERFVVFALLPILLLAGGCSHRPKGPTEIAAIAEQERQFSGALQYLRSGKEQKARDLLEMVCAAQSLPGVTDEALFRLALLELRDESAKGIARSLELLGRLKDEYPRSIWTHQAAPLASLLATVKTLNDSQRELKYQRELKTLRELNLTLSRDNRELRQTIERLKSLDMELEQKIKR